MVLSFGCEEFKDYVANMSEEDYQLIFDRYAASGNQNHQSLEEMLDLVGANIELNMGCIGLSRRQVLNPDTFDSAIEAGLASFNDPDSPDFEFMRLFSEIRQLLQNNARVQPSSSRGAHPSHQQESRCRPRGGHQRANPDPQEPRGQPQGAPHSQGNRPRDPPGGYPPRSRSNQGGGPSRGGGRSGPSRREYVDGDEHDDW